MKYTLDTLDQLAADLTARQAELAEPAEILKDPALKDALAAIAEQPAEQRAAYGQRINEIKQTLLTAAEQAAEQAAELPPLDVSAPFDVNTNLQNRPRLLGPVYGSLHPVMRELQRIGDIFTRMGFDIYDSPHLDDDYHMFTSLNFPPDHPARDDYDTFMTEDGLILPAHTSTMQHRILSESHPPIRAVIPGRVFRNEDVDATHEHTFHQVEGIYVDRGVSLADMFGTLKTFLESYFDEAIEYRTQPFYFPFVEPGLEYLIRMPQALRRGGQDEEWLEIMGCGMIHPAVLKEAGLDPEKYAGFAWGMGVERLVMLRSGIDDVRHFMSGRLEFLERFKGQV